MTTEHEKRLQEAASNSDDYERPLGMGETTVTIETEYDGNGVTITQEYEIASFTDVNDKYVLIDSEGRPRAMISTAELAEMGGKTPEVVEEFENRGDAW